MSIPFVDLKTQYSLIKGDVSDALDRVFDHGQFVMGPEIEELEGRLADFVGSKFALCCSSGTDALVLPLLAKNLSKNDAVITTPFTFFATAEAIVLAGATPVFSDVDPMSFNLDPDLLEITIQETLNTGGLRPAGIVAVDLFGNPADFEKINDIAEKYGLFVIEDAAQSFGAVYRNKKAGNLADIAATSFFPAKPLGCYGDGGAVFTNDQELFGALKSLRVHGQSLEGDKYENIKIGLNARMDTIQAAILLQKLSIYQEEFERRNYIAQKYTDCLNECVELQFIQNDSRSAWAQFTILSDKRDDIQLSLTNHGIPTAIYYKKPLHLSPALFDLGYEEGNLVNSELLSNKVISLPMHAYLEDETVEWIASLVCDVVKNS